MAITAAMVKELRERTGAGMMECKKALVETDGDMDAAAGLLRAAGAAKADGKAGRIAAEGSIGIARSGNAVAIIEVNCETDFAARNEEFLAFVDILAARALSDRPANLAALAAMPLADTGISVEESLKELSGRIGEKLSVRRFEAIEGDVLGSYLHRAGSSARIGAVVGMQGGDKNLARDIAMHVAALRPRFIHRDQAGAAVPEQDKQIHTQEPTLLEQAFVKDPDTTVEELLKSRNARVVSLTRFELGEGIEKKAESFADEVMAQARAVR